jgi:hypothetical protein
MRCAEIVRILRDQQHELRRRFGVRSLAIFGSLARDAATETSDVDLLVEFDRPIGLLHLIDTQQHLERLLGVSKVDLVLRHAVIRELRNEVLSEAIDVFPAEKMEVSPASHAGSD